MSDVAGWIRSPCFERCDVNGVKGGGVVGVRPQARTGDEAVQSKRGRGLSTEAGSRTEGDACATQDARCRGARLMMQARSQARSEETGWRWWLWEKTKGWGRASETVRCSWWLAQWEALGQLEFRCNGAGWPVESGSQRWGAR